MKEYIIGIVVPLVAVLITECIVTYRERKHIKTQMKLSCLQEYISWIDGVSIDIKKLSRSVDNCLNRHDIKDRESLVNSVTEEYNVLTERVKIFTTSHVYINNATDIELGMKAFGDNICKKLEELYMLIKKYINIKDNIQALDDNNRLVKEMSADIDKQCSKISNEIQNMIR